MIIVYTLNFMDKNALTYSANFGLLTDSVRLVLLKSAPLLQANYYPKHLHGNQYSWASGSIFYLGRWSYPISFDLQFKKFSGRINLNLLNSFPCQFWSVHFDC